jgi:hypothetical protein
MNFGLEGAGSRTYALSARTELLRQCLGMRVRQRSYRICLRWRNKLRGQGHAPVSLLREPALPTLITPVQQGCMLQAQSTI